MSNPAPTSNRPPFKLVLQTRSKDILHGLKIWLADRTERDTLIAGLRTMAWLVPLTLLIWIWAEREQVVKYEDQTIPIDVRSDDSTNVYVKLELQAGEDSITAELDGARGRLDEVRQKIQPAEGRPSVVLTIPDGLSPGTHHELDVADLLNRNDIFAGRGVVVSNCKPAKIRVFVDSFKTETIDVRAPASVTNLVGVPIFDPPKVDVRAPASAFNGSAITVEANLERTGLLDSPGIHQAVVVPLSSPQLPGDGVTFYPSKTVKATFEVRQRDVDTTIPSMPVWVSGPKSVLDRYSVECEPSVFSVKVKGPPDKISEMQQSPTVTPYAVLTLTGDDRPSAGPITRRLNYVFPENVRDSIRVAPEEMQRTINFRLVERTPDQ